MHRPLDGPAVAARIRAFILDQFPLARQRGLKNDDPLLGNGIVDSLGILDVVAFLEQELGINVDDEDLVPEHFDSIETITRFVERKRPHEPTEPAGS